MECLSKLVGIKNTCATPVSHSDYWLDDIDVTLSEIEKYTEKDNSSAYQLTVDKINFSARSVADMIHQNFRGKYIATSMLSNGRVGYEQDNKILVATNNQRKGIILETCNLNSFTKFYISRLSLYLDTTGNVDVRVYDVTQGKLLDTITVATVAREITYANVNKSYTSLQKRMKLAFIYDATGHGSYTTYLGANGCYTCNSGYGSTKVNNYVNAQSVTIPLASDEVQENFTNISETGGLAVHFNLSCDHENWLCDIGNVVALPILYKAAAEIMRFASMKTDRFNTKAGNDEARMKTRLDYYELRFRESMDAILPQIKPPNDQLCFSCRDRIMSKVILP